MRVFICLSEPVKDKKQWARFAQMANDTFRTTLVVHGSSLGDRRGMGLD